MSTPRLTATSYMVLGLVERCQPATPYEIKQVAARSTANFWTVPHTQLYTECARMADAGLLDEVRESGGRRRRTYSLTSAGQVVLDEWRAEPVVEPEELRDPGLLKLFLGADPTVLAPAQLELHREKLAEFEATALLEMPGGMRLALEAGIGHEKEFIRFWERMLAND